MLSLCPNRGKHNATVSTFPGIDAWNECPSQIPVYNANDCFFPPTMTMPYVYRLNSVFMPLPQPLFPCVYVDDFVPRKGIPPCVLMVCEEGKIHATAVDGVGHTTVAQIKKRKRKKKQPSSRHLGVK